MRKERNVFLFLFFLLLLVTKWYYSRLQIATVRHHEINVSSEEISPIFKSKQLVIWSSDFHIGPIHDLKNYLQPMGVRFIDKSLDIFRCQHTQTCHGRKSLKLINPENAMNLSYEMIARFHSAYQNDSEIASSDAFTCSHVTSLCEIYEPFNKSLIIIATTRYELGRFGKQRWTTWNSNLIRFASKPWNVVAANNLYDVEYIKYFTGIQPLLLPSFCGYTNQVYNQSRQEFLFADNSNHAFFKIFLKNFTDAYQLANSTFHIIPLRQKYRDYKYFEIAAHQGIVHVPYQVSVMSFFEQYRMSVPLFAPTRELLVDWEYNHQAMLDRTWEGSFRKFLPNRSAIDPHPSQRHVPDPNSYTENAIRYWVNFADYYQFPNIKYYASISDLVQMLQTITSEELLSISERMKSFNIREDKRLRTIWKNILLRIANHSSNKPY